MIRLAIDGLLSAPSSNVTRGLNFVGVGFAEAVEFVEVPGAAAVLPPAEPNPNRDDKPPSISVLAAAGEVAVVDGVMAFDTADSEEVLIVGISEDMLLLENIVVGLVAVVGEIKEDVLVVLSFCMNRADWVTEDSFGTLIDESSGFELLNLNNDEVVIVVPRFGFDGCVAVVDEEVLLVTAEVTVVVDVWLEVWLLWVVWFAGVGSGAGFGAGAGAGAGWGGGVGSGTGSGFGSGIFGYS